MTTPVVLQNRGYITLRVAPVFFESNQNVDAVVSGGSTAKNSKSAWSCCVIGTSEQTFLQPRCIGLVCLGAKNLAKTLVVIVVACPEAVELLSKSFT